MRHVSHGLNRGLRHLDIVVTWLKRNAAFVAVSLLVPLVALGALAIPPRLVQGVAAPLWRAIASPPGDVPARHIAGLRGDSAAAPFATEGEAAPLARARARVAMAHVMGGLPGPGRRAGDQRPANGGPESAGEPKTKPPTGDAGATADDAEPSEGTSGGDGDAGAGGGSGGRDETGSERGDRPGGGRGNRPGRGNGDGCSAKTPRPAASRSRPATATAAEAATSVAEATAATAVSAANLATGTVVKTATPITEAAAGAGAGVGATLSGAANGAVATIAAPRRR